MARYHLNPATGEASPCKATARCPFGSAEDHFPTAEEARSAYESTMGPQVPAPAWTPTDHERETVRAEARALAAQFLEDPDWLPPVDDPAKPDGVPEEEGYVTSLEAFKDPLLAMGNCSVVADAVSAFTAGEFPVVEAEVGGPYLNLHVANLYRDPRGREWVVDYTYSQVEPSAAWPHVAPRGEWEAACEAAGWTPAEEIRAAYERMGDSSYRMTHQPQADGVQGHAVEEYYPDFYRRPELYRTGIPEADRESTAAMLAMRGNPEAVVTIYRALPSRGFGIQEGNWVTLSKSYAQLHAASNGAGEDWPIVSLRVRAKDIRSPGDSINEWGYYPAP